MSPCPIRIVPPSPAGRSFRPAPTPPHVLAQERPERLVALFLVLDGRLAVFANTRLTDQPAAVAWAEHTATDGKLFDVWWHDQNA